jgi:hypothetical protein
MTEPSKKLLKAADIEAAIMKKLAEHPECTGITYVYIKPTGRKPPDDTWNPQPNFSAADGCSYAKRDVEVA